MDHYEIDKMYASLLLVIIEIKKKINNIIVKFFGKKLKFCGFYFYLIKNEHV